MKKRDILFLSGGFLGGLIIAFILLFTAAPGMMMIEHVSPYDFETAVEKMVRVKKDVYSPDPENVAAYKDYFNVYLNLYPSLKDAFSELAAIREKA